jgi:hypothetical protein
MRRHTIGLTIFLLCAARLDLGDMTGGTGLRHGFRVEDAQGSFSNLTAEQLRRDPNAVPPEIMERLTLVRASPARADTLLAVRGGAVFGLWENGFGPVGMTFGRGLQWAADGDSIVSVIDAPRGANVFHQLLPQGPAVIRRVSLGLRPRPGGRADRAFVEQWLRQNRPTLNTAGLQLFMPAARAVVGATWFDDAALSGCRASKMRSIAAGHRSTSPCPSAEHRSGSGDRRESPSPPHAAARWPESGRTRTEYSRCGPTGCAGTEGARRGSHAHKANPVGVPAPAAVDDANPALVAARPSRLLHFHRFPVQTLHACPDAGDPGSISIAFRCKPSGRRDRRCRSVDFPSRRLNRVAHETATAMPEPQPRQPQPAVSPRSPSASTPSVVPKPIRIGPKVRAGGTQEHRS